MMADSLESVVRSSQISRRVVVPADDVHFFTATAAQADPSVAPPGEDTLYLYVPIMPLDPHGGWSEHEQAAAEAIVAKAAEFYHGIEEYEIGAASRRRPIAGLYLGGSGSRPRFGMTGLPGLLSAKELLRDRQALTSDGMRNVPSISRTSAASASSRTTNAV